MSSGNISKINKAMEACMSFINAMDFHKTVPMRYPNFCTEGFNENNRLEIDGILFFFDAHALSSRADEVQSDFRSFNELCEDKVLKLRIILYCTRKCTWETDLLYRDRQYRGSILRVSSAEKMVEAATDNVEAKALKLEIAKAEVAGEDPTVQQVKIHLIESELALAKSQIQLKELEVATEKVRMESCKTSWEEARQILSSIEREKNTLISELEVLLQKNSL